MNTWLRIQRPRCTTGALCLAAVLLGGCTVGPKYAKPTTEIPAAYKETANWKQAQPGDQNSKGKWWEVYQDPQLNALEDQVSVSNQNLKAAQAIFQQARDAVRIFRASLFPNVTGSAAATRTGQSQNVPLRGSSPNDYNNFTLPVDISYEADVWGRVQADGRNSEGRSAS